MKKHSLITVLATALIGVSAAGFPAAPGEPNGIVAEAANEQTYTYGDCEYSYVPGSGEVTLKSYNANSSFYSISAWVPAPDGSWKTVTKIGNSAFSGKSIASVTIPSTVTEIGTSAFLNTSLTSLVIPSSVTMVQRGAFKGCHSLTNLEIQGPSGLRNNAFYDCSSLRIVKMHKDCTGESANVFGKCPKISTINNSSVWTYSLVNGAYKPIFTSNSYARTLIKRFFWNSTSKCEFIDSYCTALCDYVVKTETTYGSGDDWMCEAVKARQLYKWLIDNCHFETDNSAFQRFENQDYTSVFLSYGLDGEGESVCTGYSKAYSMLLKAAGIESYLVRANLSEWGLSQMTPEELAYWGIQPGGTGGHMWNIVKADGKYYQCDVSRGDNPGVGYLTFMRTDMEMFGIHDYLYTSTELSLSQNNVHPYLSFDASLGEYARSHCYYNFNDNNYDGILDGNYDLNASVTSYDNTYRTAIAPYFNNGFVLTNDSLSVFLDYLHLSGLSPNGVLIRLMNGYHII